MVSKVEVIYFPKPCPHCKEPLFRVRKMSAEWSECRNKVCPYVLGQTPKKKMLRGIELEWEPEEYRECFNRR